jgi:hypothetical protein
LTACFGASNFLPMNPLPQSEFHKAESMNLSSLLTGLQSGVPVNFPTQVLVNFLAERLTTEGGLVNETALASLSERVTTIEGNAVYGQAGGPSTGAYPLQNATIFISGNNAWYGPAGIVSPLQAVLLTGGGGGDEPEFSPDEGMVFVYTSGGLIVFVGDQPLQVPVQFANQN